MKLLNRIKSNWIDFNSRLDLSHSLDYEKSPLFLTENIRLGACKKEPDTVRWIESFKSDEVAYDVGACVGAYSLIMSLYAKEVFAFEPAVTNFNLMTKNIVLNKRKLVIHNNINPFNFAISNKTAIKKFNYVNLNPGKSGHQVESEIDGFGNQFTPEYSSSVMCYSLDDLVYNLGLPAPNHIKVDVDGHELKVLEGAENILQSDSLNTILVEMDDDTVNSSAIKYFLTENGFKVRARFKLINNFEFYNYLFTR